MPRFARVFSKETNSHLVSLVSRIFSRRQTRALRRRLWRGDRDGTLKVKVETTTTGSAGNSPISSTERDRNGLAKNAASARNFRFVLHSDALATTFSALYGKLLVVMGIAFPMAEVISTYIPPSFYEGFYLYLYFGSMIFLVYMYATLLRDDKPKSSKSRNFLFVCCCFFFPFRFSAPFFFSFLFLYIHDDAGFRRRPE